MTITVDRSDAGSPFDVNDVPRPKQNTPEPLWVKARDNGLVPEGDMMRDLILAGTKVGDAKGRHADPRQVAQLKAEVSINAIANANYYLASLLPEE